MGYRPFGSTENAVTVQDVWQMRDGESILVTNRLSDLPNWFSLRKEEVSSVLLPSLGRDYAEPEETVQGPNVWRVGAGSRVAWVRPSSAFHQPGDAIMGFLDFRANSVVLGETDFRNMEYFLSFGSVGNQTDEAIEASQAAYALAQALGCPRELSVEWLFGA